jgi:hypothetical protein
MFTAGIRIGENPGCWYYPARLSPKALIVNLPPATASLHNDWHFCPAKNVVALRIDHFDDGRLR